MAGSSELKVPMREAMRSVTLHVRVTGLWVAAFRLWIGCRVMKLAALIMGCGIEIEVADAWHRA